MPVARRQSLGQGLNGICRRRWTGSPGAGIAERWGPYTTPLQPLGAVAQSRPLGPLVRGANGLPITLILIQGWRNVPAFRRFRSHRDLGSSTIEGMAPQFRCMADSGEPDDSPRAALAMKLGAASWSRFGFLTRPRACRCRPAAWYAMLGTRHGRGQLLPQGESRGVVASPSGWQLSGGDRG